MDLPSYPIVVSEDGMQFEFISIGKRGLILKRVIFTDIAGKQIYNVAFGDVIPNSNTIDDLVVTDNGDTIILLNTLMQILQLFVEENQEARILISGSTSSRNRFYRMLVSKHEIQIKLTHQIFMYFNNKWIIFQKNHALEAVLLIPIG